MYRQILIPDKQNHSVELPENMFGKKVEVIAFEITEEELLLPRATGKQRFLDDIKAIPDFPSIEDIRKGAWPERY